MNSAPLTSSSSSTAAAPSAPDSLPDGDASDTYSKLLEERMRDVAQEATAHAMAHGSSDALKNGVAPSVPAQSDQGNMAELLEAAAKATSESQRWNNTAGHGLRKVAGHANLRGSAFEEDGHDAAGLKRKRTPEDATRDGHEDAGGDDYSTGAPSPSKRTKVAPSARAQPHANTPAAQSTMDIDTPSPQHNVAQSAHMQSLGMTDVRAAVGVHSAAALFRQTPTDSRKKYTRPPMHKLFSDLQLTPENFVRLQACAKAYMLDDTHPERQECVGNRGKGDADMVKLRLFNCARDFLNGAVGERFFGPYVPAPTEYDTIDGKPVAPDRKWIWPRDANKIVSLVTPLLRRMVTNERQRQYAQETRKGGSKKQDTTMRDWSQEASPEKLGAAMDAADQRPPSQPPLDPSLHSHHQSSLLAHSSPYQSPQRPHQPHPQENYPQFFQIPRTNSQAFIVPTSSEPTSPSMARQTLSPRGHSSPQASPRMSNTPLTQQQQQHHPSTTYAATPTPTAAAAPLPVPPVPTTTATTTATTTSYPPPRPSENVIQILITRNNIKLAPRIDLPSFPSTPHHTMPLAQLRGIVGEEVRALVRSGVVQGQVQDVGNDAPTARVGDADTARMGEGEAPGGGAAIDGAIDHNTNGGDATAPQTQQHEHAETGPTSPLKTSAQHAPVVLPPRYELRALTGRGLLLVETERDWQGVLAEVANAVWMEGAVRVVAEVLAA
ncbi:hypothetical protein BKA80DRAFT_310855 [Phyllosticta citrichinensis]